MTDLSDSQIVRRAKAAADRTTRRSSHPWYLLVIAAVLALHFLLGAPLDEIRTATHAAIEIAMYVLAGAGVLAGGRGLYDQWRYDRDRRGS